MMQHSLVYTAITTARPARDAQPQAGLATVHILYFVKQTVNDIIFLNMATVYTKLPAYVPTYTLIIH